MSSDLSIPARPARPGWAARLVHTLGGRRAAPPPHAAEDEIAKVAGQLIADDRCLFVLLKDAPIEEAEAAPAWRALDRQMALVPYGIVPVLLADGTCEPTEVPAFYLNRYAVTNGQFQKFVRAGGYDALEIWPREVWPGLMRFTDQSRRPGPRDWEDGQHPLGEADHPVVGVCWFEALAYARWAGKRLPSVAEWQKAGGWPEQLSGGACNRYPWGDVFDPIRANLWASGVGRVVPVHEYPKGATPNGVHQMTGNVWEWLDDPLGAIPCHPDELFESFRPLRRIVGGAFDTYMPSEATCQFVTGQPELDRRHNIGFRCAVAAERLRPPP